MFFLKLFFSNATKHWKILINVYIKIYKAFKREQQSLHCFLIILLINICMYMIFIIHKI